MNKQHLHTVACVTAGSIAEELEIEAGDTLMEINGTKIEDIFDYQYLTQDEYIEVLIRKPSGEEWLLEIDKEYDEDLGITFENGLMDEYRSCDITSRRSMCPFRQPILNFGARCSTTALQGRHWKRHGGSRQRGLS